MIDPASVLVGAVSGAAATDVYNIAKDKANEAVNGEMPEHGPIELRMLVDLVASIEMAIRDTIGVKKPDKDIVVHFNTTNEYRFKRQGYKHISILSSIAANITVVPPGISAVTFPITSGWNPFDVPEDSQLFVAGGQSFTTLNVIMRWGDESIDMEGV